MVRCMHVSVAFAGPTDWRPTANRRKLALRDSQSRRLQLGPVDDAKALRLRSATAPIDRHALAAKDLTNSRCILRHARARGTKSLRDKPFDIQDAVHPRHLVAASPKPVTDRLSAARTASSFSDVLVRRPLSLR